MVGVVGMVGLAALEGGTELPGARYEPVVYSSEQCAGNEHGKGLWRAGRGPFRQDQEGQCV